MSFAGRVVLVTGAGRGIGRAIAAAFAREGAQVILNDLLPQAELDQAAAEMAGAGPRLLALRADVSRWSEVARMLAQVEESCHRLNVLVNNAGIIRRGDIETVTERDWEEVLAVNLTGVFNCSKAAVGLLKRQGGKIVNVSSVAAKTGDITSAPGYASAKAGVDALTKSLARQLAHYGINVNGVAPHAIETEMSAQWSPERRRAILEAIPLGRLGRPEDVAEAVLFLASAKAGFITGEILDVNGGFLMD